MKIEPAGHRVIVKPDALEEVTQGGIIIAHGADKKRKEQAQQTGVIVSVGPNAWKAFDDGTPWAAVGDRVYFAKYGGHIIEDDGQEYRLLNDEDITAIIREDAVPAEPTETYFDRLRAHSEKSSQLQRLADGKYPSAELMGDAQ